MPKRQRTSPPKRRVRGKEKRGNSEANEFWKTLEAVDYALLEEAQAAARKSRRMRAVRNVTDNAGTDVNVGRSSDVADAKRSGEAVDVSSRSKVVEVTKVLAAAQHGPLPYHKQDVKNYLVSKESDKACDAQEMLRILLTEEAKDPTKFHVRHL